MTSTNPEILLSPKSYNETLIIGSFNSLSPKLQSDWLRVRQNYMELMGWHFGPDSDEYDKDKATVHLILQDEHKKITAGMRLTPRDSIKDTLSWSMLPNENQDLIRSVNGKVWDLTRLVPGAIDSNGDRMAAFAELFGAGLASNLQVDDNPHWVFAITEPFLKAFKKYGIEFTPISRIDDNGALLAEAYPVERTAYLNENKDQFSAAYESVKRGIERSARGQLG